jgi:hypothetical protein
LPGCSILITFAPRSPSNCVQNGPANTRECRRGKLDWNLTLIFIRKNRIKSLMLFEVKVNMEKNKLSNRKRFDAKTRYAGFMAVEKNR